MSVPLWLIWRLVIAAAAALVAWYGLPRIKGVGHALAIAAVVLIGLDTLFRTVAGLFSSAPSPELRERVEERLPSLVVSLQQATGIPLEAIGVTVFVVRRTWRHPKWGLQMRTGRFRMTATPRPTSIKWTKDKGLLGKCRHERRDVDIDHPAYYANLMNCSDAQWKAQPEAVRQKLTYWDYTQIREFGYVLASPVLRGGHYRGCVVVQVDREYKDKLAPGTEARALIHIAANDVGLLL